MTGLLLLQNGIIHNHFIVFFFGKNPCGIFNYLCKNSMIINKKYFLATAFMLGLISTFPVRAQKTNVKDSAVSTPLISIHYSYQMPGGVLANRFGNNSSIGGNFQYKTKKNILFGVEGNFLFGNTIKDDSLFINIMTNDGQIINGNGEFATVNTFERGFTVTGKVGKIFSVLAPNPNSGLMVSAGVGLLQHKIRIEVPGNTVLELNGDYKKGYDKLTNGFCATEFIGYVYFGNHRLVNFFGGVEFTQAWTKCRRDFNFDIMAKDYTKRLDLLYGIKAGWIIPFYYRTKRSTYYY